MSPPSLRLCCRLPTVRERLAALVKHPLSDRTRALGRFIPARAGNTTSQERRWRPTAVHPRPRGEHPVVPTIVMAYGGSSPPARGTPGGADDRDGVRRFIPARAGNTPTATSPTAWA